MWVANEQNGFGVEKWNDGSYYEGNFKKGMKAAEGLYHCSDGSYYKGNWENNLIHGYGKYVWENGRSY